MQNEGAILSDTRSVLPVSFTTTIFHAGPVNSVDIFPFRIACLLWYYKVSKFPLISKPIQTQFIQSLDKSYKTIQ